MKKALIPIIIGLLVYGCTKDIEYRGADSGPILVANSMNRAGDVPYVKLTHSTFFLEPRNVSCLITDANVSICIDGVSRDLTYDSSAMRYSDTRTLQPGNIISISADHPQYGHVRATDTVPQPVVCSIDTFYRPFSMKGVEIDTMYYFGLDIGSIDSVCTFDLSLKKGQAEHQYYQLEFDPYATMVICNDEAFDTIQVPLSYRLPTPTMVAIEMIDTADAFIDMMDLVPVICTGANSFTFTDKQLADTTHFEFEILREAPDSLLKWSLVHTDYSVKVNVRSMSLAAYTYMMSVSRYRNQGGIMSEPVTLWNNINGGTGILGTYVEYRDSIGLVRY